MPDRPSLPPLPPPSRPPFTFAALWQGTLMGGALIVAGFVLAHLAR